MSRTPTQITIDEEVKREATELFGKLGLDISSAINVFLKQSLLRGGFPFEVKIPHYKTEVMEAMEEAKYISKSESVKGYYDIDEAFEELEK